MCPNIYREYYIWYLSGLTRSDKKHKNKSEQQEDGASTSSAKSAKHKSSKHRREEAEPQEESGDNDNDDDDEDPPKKRKHRPAEVQPRDKHEEDEDDDFEPPKPKKHRPTQIQPTKKHKEDEDDEDEPPKPKKHRPTQIQPTKKADDDDDDDDDDDEPAKPKKHRPNQIKVKAIVHAAQDVSFITSDSGQFEGDNEHVDVDESNLLVCNEMDDDLQESTIFSSTPKDSSADGTFSRVLHMVQAVPQPAPVPHAPSAPSAPISENLLADALRIAITQTAHTQTLMAAGELQYKKYPVLFLILSSLSYHPITNYKYLRHNICPRNKKF